MASANGNVVQESPRLYGLGAESAKLKSELPNLPLTSAILASKASNNLYYICNTVSHALYDLYEHIVAELGKQGGKTAVPADIYKEPRMQAAMLDANDFVRTARYHLNLPIHLVQEHIAAKIKIYDDRVKVMEVVTAHCNEIRTQLAGMSTMWPQAAAEEDAKVIHDLVKLTDPILQTLDTAIDSLDGVLKGNWFPKEPEKTIHAELESAMIKVKALQIFKGHIAAKKGKKRDAPTWQKCREEWNQLWPAVERDLLKDKLPTWEQILGMAKAEVEQYRKIQFANPEETRAVLTEIATEYLTHLDPTMIASRGAQATITADRLAVEDHQNISAIGCMELACRIVAQGCKSLDDFTKMIDGKAFKHPNRATPKDEPFYTSVVFVCQNDGNNGGPMVVTTSLEYSNYIPSLDAANKALRNRIRVVKKPVSDSDVVGPTNTAEKYYNEVERLIGNKSGPDAVALRQQSIRKFRTEHSKGYWSHAKEHAMALWGTNLVHMGRCPRCTYTADYDMHAKCVSEEQAAQRSKGGNWVKFNLGHTCAETMAVGYCKNTHVSA
ncbi:hypothetical protein B0T26DRAFT_707319 [Lasiosphaeria miniovina]|uniref:Uncharacterized protein n=1 Tax=Lasiosphaeria miniovina TaxID=1954250 RepID=A0AA40DXM3_9PEZI|nr:uncharacterized protein B0T26DRAFT_707319 [Lasiosphaeria miniovina]KAK0716811.1 hypothetical protein B0T26DRAFT_707319 [Lasiosphaeria miniovina]